MSDEISEELKEIWKDDKLGRMEDADLIRRFLIGQLDLCEKSKKPRTFVLNIDSQWGGGKTFFLERFKKHLEQENHICVYVNAWEDDHCDDPLIAVVSAVTTSLNKLAPRSKYKGSLTSLTKFAGKILVDTAIKTAQHQIEKVAGEGAVSEITATFSDAAVDAIGGSVLRSFEDQKQTIEDFKVSLTALATNALASQKKTGPLFILIDELDRCRPDYAIKLLERVKHLFSVENIVFIVATDTHQLSKAISGTYGSEFDGARYLKRFFDRTFYFPEATKENFISATFDELGLSGELFVSPPEYDPVSLINLLCSIEEVELRDIKQMLSILQTFASVWEYASLRMNLIYLFPLIYQLHKFGQCALSEENKMLQVILEYQYYDSSTGRNSTSKNSVKKIINVLTAHAKNIFSESPQKHGAVDEWAYQIFSLEQSILHKNQYRRGVATPSVLLQYPSLVGRLSRLNEETHAEDSEK